jgi:predicted GIY-YIG superfamily endonuclease
MIPYLLKRQHNDTGFKASQTTSKYPGPWELVWSQDYRTRSEALAFEKKIKKREIGRFLEQ